MYLFGLLKRNMLLELRVFVTRKRRMKARQEGGVSNESQEIRYRAESLDYLHVHLPASICGCTDLTRR